ncbi:hypothetical protein MRB53_038672 [Persea americana]|nr:hypothetical protein MRB53_038672 [Persea americana]
MQPVRLGIRLCFFPAIFHTPMARTTACSRLCRTVDIHEAITTVYVDPVSRLAQVYCSRSCTSFHGDLRFHVHKLSHRRLRHSHVFGRFNNTAFKACPWRQCGMPTTSEPRSLRQHDEMLGPQRVDICLQPPPWTKICLARTPLRNITNGDADGALWLPQD